MDAIDFLQQEEVKAFIRENLSRDVSSFLLNPPKKWKTRARIIADQIISRQKSKGKLPSWYENFDLIFPPPLSIEQASSEATGRYKSSLLKGKHLVDLTGGTGIDFLWMLQGFKYATYVEQSPEIAEVFKHNIMVLKRRAEVINTSAEDYLKTFTQKATFYLDPARRNDAKDKVFKLEDCTPNIIELQEVLRKKGEKVLIKLSPLMDLSILLQTIGHISEIHIVSVRNECKEILVLIEPNEVNSSPKFVAVNLESDDPSFSFKKEHEESAKTAMGFVDTFLYEPNASILKAGAFKLVAEAYGL